MDRSPVIRTGAEFACLALINLYDYGHVGGRYGISRATLRWWVITTLDGNQAVAQAAVEADMLHGC